jgi:hypothetical protein
MCGELPQVLVGWGGVTQQVQVVGVGKVRRAERRDAEAGRRERAQRGGLGDADH